MGARDAIAKLLTGIKAFHSSPHDFDRFDLSKIGTGEGAQVYGHGLYFAENPKVSGRGGRYWDQFLHKFSDVDERSAAEQLKAHGFDREAAIAASQKKIDDLRNWHPNEEADYLARILGEEYTNAAIKQAEAEHAHLTSGRIVGPRTYEVNINADPAHMLNWDKTLDKQSVWDRIPGNVRDTIDELYDMRGLNAFSDAPEAYTGKDLHKALTHYETQEAFPSFPGENWDNAKVNAAGFLNQVAGVPGIQYLDEVSRNLPDKIKALQFKVDTASTPVAESIARNQLQQLQRLTPTSNYVVFDPANVDIMKKYGVVGAPAGTIGMGALAGQDQYEAPQ